MDPNPYEAFAHESGEKWKAIMVDIDEVAVKLGATYGIEVKDWFVNRCPICYVSGDYMKSNRTLATCVQRGVCEGYSSEDYDAKTISKGPYDHRRLCETCNDQVAGQPAIETIPCRKVQVCAWCLGLVRGKGGSALGFCSYCYKSAPADESGDAELTKMFIEKHFSPLWAQLYGATNLAVGVENIATKSNKKRPDVIIDFTIDGVDFRIWLEIDQHHADKMLEDMEKNVTNFGTADDAGKDIVIGIRLVPSRNDTNKKDRNIDDDVLTAPERWAEFGSTVDGMIRILQKYGYEPKQVPGWMTRRSKTSHLLLYMHYDKKRQFDMRWNTVVLDGPPGMPEECPDKYLIEPFINHGKMTETSTRIRNVAERIPFDLHPRAIDLLS